ncbi:zinc metallopeptidase, M23 family [Campylobacter blaseri]|uniref:M23ase beta-sheet core domain-containing protein n=1 Tax=Campylobacter blaseri TaxID=2042961 RepID=A0A2P8R020_9BACT|nr:peptidoglycan DD-metalloendopeptidase family protein [Campylobacter blaseri]PSM51849.1 hypothetical protein CQ405_06910 [Campylobacter blaseri]PSM53640.1 hypothetical protein CRN67_06915 [Campylobacter blaseri]QKF86455.1 zinc metallopeptidase, M23 family [Campylobacter blaseri]
MRFFLILLCVNLSFIYAKTTEDKIKSTYVEIRQSKTQSQTLSKKIDDLGNAIVNETKELEKTNKEIDEITGLVVNLSQKYKDEEVTLSRLKVENKKLLKDQNKLEEKIAVLIANDFAFSLLQKDDLKTTESIVSNEVFNSLNEILQEELKGFLKNYQKAEEEIEKKSMQIDSIEKNIKEYNDKKLELSQAKTKQERLVANLNKNKEAYIVRLEKLHKDTEELRNTLKKLKIIDREEKAKAAKKVKEEKLAKEDTSKTPIKDKRIKDIDQKVKQYGSSYQASKVKKYAGKKTISPLKSAYIKRKFGNYTDPIYGIKLFNESIVLGSKEKNAQVYSVLPGKVIFAKETPILDKVIIMENVGGIHTIYAHLSQIAPTIKVGSTVKKGYAIGRVEEDLTFEVTEKNYHINPLDLIILK